jgi:uncharacterized membrane protein YhaH (DUF805 family)
MNFSLLQLLQAYARNKDLIQANIRGLPIEHNSDKDDKTILGMSVAVFVVLFIFSLVIWLWLLVLTIERWHRLPSWAQILAVLCLLPVIPMGPVIGLVTVYIASDSK